MPVNKRRGSILNRAKHILHMRRLHGDRVVVHSNTDHDEAEVMRAVEETIARRRTKADAEDMRRIIKPALEVALLDAVRELRHIAEIARGYDNRRKIRSLADKCEKLIKDIPDL